MEVRPYENKDLNRVFNLIKTYEDSKGALANYNLMYKEKVVLKLIDSFGNTSFVLENGEDIRGVMLGCVLRYPLSDELMYQEYLWYVDEDHRKHSLKLYNFLENYCKANKIKHILLGHMGGVDSESMDKLYNKLGYRLVEKHFIKTMEG